MTKSDSNQTVSSQFDTFLEECAMCPDCVVDDEFAVCQQHSDDWNQYYRHQWEYLELTERRAEE